MIHPTAIVDPEARLGEGVQVGPYAVIGPQVTIDDGCVIGGHAVIESHVRIGRNGRISPFVSIGSPPQDLTFKGGDGAVEIGEGCTLREHVTVIRGASRGRRTTRVGKGALLMAYSHVGHDCRLGDGVILSNAATLSGHVEVGTGAVIGGLAAVQPFVRIGAYSIVGALSGVSLDIPPYVTAMVSRERKGTALFGLNLIGLKRQRFSPGTIAELKKAYRILFRSGLPLLEATAKVEAECAPLKETKHLVEFLRSSRRGVQR